MWHSVSQSEIGSMVSIYPSICRGIAALQANDMYRPTFVTAKTMFVIGSLHSHIDEFTTAKGVACLPPHDRRSVSRLKTINYKIIFNWQNITFWPA